MNTDDQMWQPWLVTAPYRGKLQMGRSHCRDWCPVPGQTWHSAGLEKWHTAQPTASWACLLSDHSPLAHLDHPEDFPNRFSHCCLRSDVSKWLLAPIHLPLPEAPLEQPLVILMEDKGLLKGKPRLWSPVERPLVCQKAVMLRGQILGACRCGAALENRGEMDWVQITRL